MAKYKKVKRYHRSFYSPGMWVKKAVGIIVLVAVVLVVGWLAASYISYEPQTIALNGRNNLHIRMEEKNTTC